MLSFVQQKGNTTVYEWKTGNVPTVIERPVVEEAPPDTVTEEAVSNQLNRLIVVQVSMSALIHALFYTD